VALLLQLLRLLVPPLRVLGDLVAPVLALLRLLLVLALPDQLGFLADLLLAGAMLLGFALELVVEAGRLGGLLVRLQEVDAGFRTAPEVGVGGGAEGDVAEAGLGGQFLVVEDRLAVDLQDLFDGGQVGLDLAASGDLDAGQVGARLLRRSPPRA
jgi:hypothetical protein